MTGTVTQNEVKRSKIILIILYFGFISLGLPDTILGVAWPEMRFSFKAPLELAGLLLSLTTIISVLSSLASGILLSPPEADRHNAPAPLSFKRFFRHKWNTGMILSVSAALTSIALLGYGASPSIAFVFAFTLLFGIGQGAVDTSVNAYMARNYSASHMNWIHCCWGIGASSGPLILSLIFGMGLSWRIGYFSIAAIQVVLTIIFFATLKLWDIPKKLLPDEAPCNGISASIVEPPKNTSLKSNGGGLIGAAAGTSFYFFYPGLEIVTGLWGASYMMQKFNSSPAAAGAAITMFWACLTFGRFLAGFITVKLNGQTLIRCSLILLSLAVVLAIFAPAQAIFIAALALLGFALAPLYPTMMHETPKRLKKNLANKAVGFQVGAALAGATVLPLLVGYLGRNDNILPLGHALFVFAAMIIISHEISVRCAITGKE